MRENSQEAGTGPRDKKVTREYYNIIHVSLSCPVHDLRPQQKMESDGATVMCDVKTHDPLQRDSLCHRQVIDGRDSDVYIEHHAETLTRQNVHV